MPPFLRAQKFTPEVQSQLGTFDCGTSVFARDMTDWITGPRCFASIRDRGTNVWLFRDDHGSVVGFGSVGETEWKWPDQKSPFKKMSFIPALATHSNFQRTPYDAPREEQYSMAILIFLIAQARKLGHQYLVLFAHKDNTGAQSLYEIAGFEYSPESYKGNRKMFLDVSL